MKKNTAKPKSSKAAMTLPAYQISPADSDTRFRALRLEQTFLERRSQVYVLGYVHVSGVVTKVDESQSGESGRTTGDECAVGLVAVHEASLTQHESAVSAS